ncbi:MAG: methyltransferase domain-containing protein [Solirubrobacterales bacterium]|nr:methyltransferase domain-containing protein [Solirubrobacterales bacterium]
MRAERRAQFLIDAAQLQPGVRCLELGCGTGEFTTRLVRSGCEMVAVELSEATAQECRQRLGGGAEVVVGNVETGEGLEGRCFDAMVGVSVLHHLNLELCMENTILARLKPGGRFAFSEPNMANPQVWAERHIPAIGRWRHTTPHETAFRQHELRRTFERAGLAVEVCEPFDFLHPSTPPSLLPLLRRVERSLERSPAGRIAGSVRIAGRRPPTGGSGQP